jgi:hypothetical protein
MFTVGAVALLVMLAWFVFRQNEQDRMTYDRTVAQELPWLLAIHARENLRLIAFFLGAIIVLLGVIADRMG